MPRNWKLYLLIILFLISRWGFLAQFPHFFDSPEYVRLAQTNLFSSLQASHESLHPLYLWFIHQAFQQFNTLTAISGVSALFGSLSLIGFMWLVAEIMEDKKFSQALLPLILFPGLWLIQTNIMHESLGHALLLFGTASFLRDAKTPRWWWFSLGLVCLSLALINYIGLILWWPAIFFLLYWRVPRLNSLRLLLGLIASALLAQLGLYRLLTLAAIDSSQRFNYLWQRELPQLFALLTPMGLLRTFRNCLYLVIFNYSPLFPLFFLVQLLQLIRRHNWRALLFVAAFLVCFMASMSFWHGGLYGRLGSLVGFAIAAAMTAYSSRSWNYRLSLLTTLLILIPTVSAYLSTPLPVIEKQGIDQLRPAGALIVISNQQRPQLEYLGLTNYLVVSSQNTSAAQSQIELALDQGQPVFLTHQAITAPYWQYDGQQVHIISRGSLSKADLSAYLSSKTLTYVGGGHPYSLLAIYQLTK